MIKIQIPATSANLGAGFDALGLALTYYNYIEMEECDKIDITAADGLDIPTDERIRVSVTIIMKWRFVCLMRRIRN